MKKIFISLALLAIAIMPIFLNAQNINVNALTGELKFTFTDSIVVTPGANEYLVTLHGGEKVFMISLNDELYAQIKSKGKKVVVLEGAEIDNVIRERLLKEYRKKLERKEEGINREMKALQVPPPASKAGNKETREDKKLRKQNFKEKTLELKKTQKEKEDFVYQLSSILNTRRNQGCYYVYNWEIR